MAKSKSKLSENTIHVRGCRVNNLRNIDVDIPRDKLVVITGVSGSGKSSLAFDTLYAEGERRYVESLSTYARQFVGKMNKPDCDFIDGLCPAVAIEQRVVARNARSTVGTSSEIYDYLRMLFARIGRTYSPVSGKEVRRNSVEDLVQEMTSHPKGTRVMLVCPFAQVEHRSDDEQKAIYVAEGFEHFVEHDGKQWVVIDRLLCDEDKQNVNRFMDSVRTAFYEGNGICALSFPQSDEWHDYSLSFTADGLTFEEPTDQLFSFNSAAGACETCEGFGQVLGIDEDLVIPDRERSVYDGAVVCWRGEKMGNWLKEFCRRAEYNHFPIFKPYYELTADEKAILWHGNGSGDDVCIDAFFEMLRKGQYKIQNRVMLARYRGRTVCPACRGGRLKPEATYVKVRGKTIVDLVEMPLSDLLAWMKAQRFSAHEQQVAKRLITEITHRLDVLCRLGLGYLTLNRTSNTLSGGESQRIRLGTSLGSSLVGSMYVLDEPSIGLHSRDTHNLIKVLCQLRDLGNTVIVVEHDEDTIRSADYLIDMGPGAGQFGGNVVFAGKVTKKLLDSVNDDTPSLTLRYLQHNLMIEPPESRRVWNSYIEVVGARANNLKGIDAKFPLHAFTVVTGVSGSGKSTLVRDILYRGLKRHFDEVCDRPGQFRELRGDLERVKRVEFVDQKSIGTSSRSNPVTYIGAYDEIRRLMAEQPLAKQMGFSPVYFSFNQEGGRCEECKGEGVVTIEMQFMNDLQLPCECCHGKRFKDDVLEVKYKDKNIYDILTMTVTEALEFFAADSRIVKLLQPLEDVGLGYLQLGQSSSTLSGGENQRVKLAYYLGQERSVETLFIFDEPTTGLHFHDISRLLKVFDALIKRGHTVVVIEHNLDVVRSADYVIDLGPEGGIGGGEVVVAGTPEDVMACERSYTGQYLRGMVEGI